ncbi:hypothetical protein CRE_24845 [Caenorhabditis remanei]|uniref:T-box domain-containing protein n=1 Tax=Caenorhabditis remanei TaxID=31234 RepID=E3NKH1_CAERE|nr:hypothetical protein CRE_24845 [Caenorhabditis remanei]
MSTTATSATSGIKVSLFNQDQWEKFYPQTEMILTRNKGRQLFPLLNYILKGLDPDSVYAVFLHFERVDNYKYEFSCNKWEKKQSGNEIPPIEMKQHIHGWRNGSHWMNGPVSFKHVKLTNDPDNTKVDSVYVQSMHKHLPVISILKTGDTVKEEFRLGLTEFIGVTSYQNTRICSLKIELNPHATGFKATGGHNKVSEEKNKRRGVKRPAREQPYQFSLSEMQAAPQVVNQYSAPALLNEENQMGMYPMQMAPGIPGTKHTFNSQGFSNNYTYQQQNQMMINMVPWYPMNMPMGPWQGMHMYPGMAPNMVPRMPLTSYPQNWQYPQGSMAPWNGGT